jgi:hypothetical protein
VHKSQAMAKGEKGWMSREDGSSVSEWPKMALRNVLHLCVAGASLCSQGCPESDACRDVADPCSRTDKPCVAPPGLSPFSLFLLAAGCAFSFSCGLFS